LVRYRRVSNYAQRQQTKWWVFGLLLSLILALIASFIYREFAPPLINVTPIVLTIAILRSHLWDIDIIIRRTLSYTVLTVTLAVFYFFDVVLLQSLFSGLSGDRSSPLITVLSTLAIAALFNPLRHRIQHFIDRRFYRHKYDAEQVLAHFAAAARDEVDLDALATAMLGAVADTLQPERSLLWIRPLKNLSTPTHRLAQAQAKRY